MPDTVLGAKHTTQRDDLESQPCRIRARKKLRTYVIVCQGRNLRLREVSLLFKDHRARGRSEV